MDFLGFFEVDFCMWGGVQVKEMQMFKVSFFGFFLDVFSFLIDFKRNNMCEWFNVNKFVYEMEFKKLFVFFFEVMEDGLKDLIGVFYRFKMYCIY